MRTPSTCRYRKVESHNCTHCGHCHVCGVDMQQLGTPSRRESLTAYTARQADLHQWDAHLWYEDHKQRRRQYRMGYQTCSICGTALATEYDHIIPTRRGGTDDPSNLQPACGPCNREKSDRVSLTER